MKILHNNLHIAVSPVCELLSALFLVQSYEQLLPTNPRDEIYFPNELHKWVESTRKSMDDECRKHLELFFNYESYLGLSLYQLMWKTKTYHSIPQFIDMLKELPALELISEFLQTGYNQSAPDIRDSQSVTQFIKQKSLPEVEKWKLLFLYSDAENTKINFIQLINTFHEMYISQNISDLLALQRKHMEELEEELEQDTKEKLNRLLSNHYPMLESEAQIILFPTYYGATNSSFSHYNKNQIFICTYGIGFYQIALQKAMNEERIVDAFKALSDETRIKIIKTLNTIPCYGFELAQTLKLSNSTISHHLSQLSSLGLIQAKKEENKNYYRVNKELIHSIMEKMAHFLTE